MNNMDLYNSLRAVPQEAQKAFKNGRFSGTDINPMWRIKKMTEMFGAVGFGWYYEVIKRDIITSQDGTMCAFIAINLYIKQDGEWSKPIYGEGGNTFSIKTGTGYIQTSDEAYKMALTDAVSNATKQLGLGADIWFANDVTKYTRPQPQAPVQATARFVKPTAEQIADIKAKVSKIADIGNLSEYYKTLSLSFEMNEIAPLFTAQKVEIQQNTTNA